MLFKKNKIDVIEGQAATEDGNVKVGGRRRRDRGRQGHPRHRLGAEADPRPGVRRAHLDTAAMWLPTSCPKRLAVIGAGASGTEIASAFGRLGTEVVLLEALPQILPLEDKDIAAPPPARSASRT